MRIRLKHRRLRRELARKNISQNRWAQKLGLDRGHLSKLARGKRPYPAPSTRQKLLRGLDLRFDDLFEKEQPGDDRRSRQMRLASNKRLGEEQDIYKFGQEWISAIKSLKARPYFSLTLIVVISLGIGATTSIFSIVNQVLLRPLPYPDSDRLVTVWNTYPHWQEREILSQFWDTIRLSYPEFERWSNHQTAFENVAVYGSQSMAFSGSSEPRIIPVGMASHSLFEVLGIPARLGRYFEEGDEGPGGAGTAVLSHHFWQSEFGGEHQAIGKRIRIGSEFYTVVGVAPASMELGHSSNPDLPIAVWIPLGNMPQLHDEGNHSFEAIARLKDGISLQHAAAETEILLRGDRDSRSRGARVVFRKNQETSEVSQSLLLLFGAVAILLMITCFNVAQLLITKAFERRREMAIRMALGSGKRRVTLKILLESMVLGLLGGVVGLVLAIVMTRVVVGYLPMNLPRAEHIEIDTTVYLFAFGVSLFSSLVFAVAPILSTLRVDLNEVLTESSRSTTPSLRLQWAMVATEVALSGVLLICSLLLGQTLIKIDEVDPGFKAKDLLAVSILLPAHSYREPAQINLFQQSVASSLSALPGVEGVAVTSVVPFSGAAPSNSIWARSWGPEDGAKPEAQIRRVDSSYFSVLGIPVLRGSNFENLVSSNRAIAIINEALAKMWVGKEPIGDTLIVWERPHQIVGVVANTLDRHREDEPPAAFYLPFSQSNELEPLQEFSFLLRTERELAEAASEARGVIWGQDPLIPVREVATLESIIRNSASEARSRTVLVSAFCLLALILTAAGMYALTAVAVHQQKKEIGVRMALGAGRLRIFALVLRKLLLATALGSVTGMGAAMLAGQLLRSHLFGVQPVEPEIYLSVIGLIAGIALFSGLVPALRATRLQPSRILHWE